MGSQSKTCDQVRRAGWNPGHLHQKTSHTRFHDGQGVGVGVVVVLSLHHLVLENGEGAADLGLAEEENRVAVQEGEELLRQVRVEEELLLNVALVFRGHLLFIVGVDLGKLHVFVGLLFPRSCRAPILLVLVSC